MQTLLREFKLFEAEDVTPVETGDGVLKMTGVLQRANSPNANNRIYPKPILEREDGKMQDGIKARSAVGELDHPDTPVVQLENGSHLVTKTWWDGDDLKGEVEILNTPKGRILEAYINRGVRLGISSRGLGSTSKTNEGHDLVEDDYNLITYDFVSNPSTAGAFMNLNESEEWKQFCEENTHMKIDKILDDILGM